MGWRARRCSGCCPNGGKVALIAGVVGDVGSNARIKGFQQAVEGKLEVVQLVSADWDREKALTAATTSSRRTLTSPASSPPTTSWRSACSAPWTLPARMRPR